MLKRFGYRRRGLDFDFNGKYYLNMQDKESPWEKGKIVKAFEIKVDELNVLLNFLNNEYKNIIEILGQNLIYAENHTNDDSLINSIIRMQIRSIVSILESACYSMRGVARDMCAIKQIQIPLKYSDLFKESIKFELKDKIKLSIQFVGFSISGIEKIDMESKEWQSVCASLQTRHRLTHPKSISDLNVSEKELGDANNSYFWFVKQIYHICNQDIPNISINPSEEDIKKIHNIFKEKYK